MVSSPTRDLERRLRLLRNQGMQRAYENEVVGLNNTDDRHPRRHRPGPARPRWTHGPTAAGQRRVPGRHLRGVRGRPRSLRTPRTSTTSTPCACLRDRDGVRDRAARPPGRVRASTTRPRSTGSRPFRRPAMTCPRPSRGAGVPVAAGAPLAARRRTWSASWPPWMPGRGQAHEHCDAARRPGRDRDDGTQPRPCACVAGRRASWWQSLTRMATRIARPGARRSSAPWPNCSRWASTWRSSRRRPRSMLEAGLELADAGIPTMIEKPLATDVRESHLLVDAFEAAALVNAVGHIERCNPALLALRARLDNGELGEIYQVATRRQGPFPHRDRGRRRGQGSRDPRHRSDRMGDRAPYRSVAARTAHKSGRAHEDLVSIVARMEDGTVASHLVNWLSPLKERVTVVTGERGAFVADTLTARPDVPRERRDPYRVGPSGVVPRGKRGGQHPVRHSEARAPALQLERFRDAILGRAHDLVTMREGMRTVAVADACILSAREQRMVDAHRGDRVRIAVVGLGKIGLPLAVQFADRGHEVVGVDINRDLVACSQRADASPSPARRTWTSSGAAASRPGTCGDQRLLRGGPAGGRGRRRRPVGRRRRGSPRLRLDGLRYAAISART